MSVCRVSVCQSTSLVQTQSLLDVVTGVSGWWIVITFHRLPFKCHHEVDTGLSLQGLRVRKKQTETLKDCLKQKERSGEMTPKNQERATKREMSGDQSTRSGWWWTQNINKIWEIMRPNSWSRPGPKGVLCSRIGSLKQLIILSLTVSSGKMWGLRLYKGLYCLDTGSRSSAWDLNKGNPGGRRGNCPRLGIGANICTKTCEVWKKSR